MPRRDGWGSGVAHVFISYSSQHRALTERLAGVIEARLGPDSVWWDRELRAGDVFRREITTALDRAKAAVVVWTDGAVESDWVYAEAVRAAAQRKVVTVRESSLDPQRIPLPFNVFHADAWVPGMKPGMTVIFCGCAAPGRYRIVPARRGRPQVRIGKFR